MEVSAYEIALIGVGGTIVGALIGALISYRFSLELANRNFRRAVNDRLITAFHKELGGIYPNPADWPKDIDKFLRSKFSSLQAAVGEFRQYLPAHEWEAFDKAWFNFYCSTGREVDKYCQSYLHYVDFISTTTNQETTRQDGKGNFIRNVDQILKFAK